MEHTMTLATAERTWVGGPDPFRIHAIQCANAVHCIRIHISEEMTRTSPDWIHQPVTPRSCTALKQAVEFDDYREIRYITMPPRGVTGRNDPLGVTCV